VQYFVDRRHEVDRQVLPELREKVLAARRAGGAHIVPKQNAKNINEDLTPELRKNLTVHLVSTIDEVLALALQPVASDVRPAKKTTRSVGRSPRRAPEAAKRRWRLVSDVVYSARYHVDIGPTCSPLKSTAGLRPSDRDRRHPAVRRRRAGAGRLGRAGAGPYIGNT